VAAPALSPRRRPRAVHLHVASAGNHVMREIADAFAGGFAAHGVEAEVRVDALPAPAPDVLPIVVAPHEYFPLFAADAAGDGAVEVLPWVHLLNVEQPGSQWFESACWYARRAAGVLDINATSARELGRRGLRALHAPLPYVPAPAAAPAPRDVDVVFLGVHTPRREMFFSRHAEFFAGRACRIHLARLERPRLASTPGFVTGPDLHQLLRSSRILVNVHGGDRPYFEWHRTLLAVANGCAVVSEAGDPAPLRPGEDLVVEDLGHLVTECGRLLDDEDARQRMADRARGRAEAELGADVVCGRILDAAEAPAPPARSRPLARPSAARRPGRAVAAVPKPDPLPVPARGMPAMEDLVPALVNDAARRNEAAPGVSVLVTLFNYAGHVGQAVRSAAAASTEGIPGGIEIVVVDDASSDGSFAAVEAAISGSPTPSRVFRHPENRGLAAARNRALHEARGACVFVLDADNWIYPRCLSVLHAALRAGGLHAAYAIIRKFTEGGQPAGLASFHAWDERELVRRPYVDAMALFDRRALLDVGGYSADHPWMGWEDYDLWLKLAEAGKRIALVPEVLTAYRVHPASMIHGTNRHTPELAALLEAKFAGLAARHPDLEMLFGFPRPLQPPRRRA